MKTNFFWRLTSLVVLLAMIISPAGFGSAAPVENQPAAPHPTMQVVDPSFVGESQPLRDLAPIQIRPKRPQRVKQNQRSPIDPENPERPARTAAGITPSSRTARLVP